jgi:hypothetical protein
MASKHSFRGRARRPPLPSVAQVENRGFGTLSMPATADSPLLFAFCCFPDSCTGDEEAKHAPKGVGLPQDWGWACRPGKFRVWLLTWGGRVAWILRLVKTGAEGDGQSTDVMEINNPDDLSDIADLGLSLAEAKLLLARVQRDIVAAQASAHAIRRPKCRCGGGVCHVRDYRDHAIATLFGQATVRLPRFRCATCGVIEIGINWPSLCRSTRPSRMWGENKAGKSSQP